MKKIFAFILTGVLVTPISLTGCSSSSQPEQTTTALVSEPSTVKPTTLSTTVATTTLEPTTVEPTTMEPTTVEPTTEKPTEPPKASTYASGQHKVGSDIPAGRYVLYCTGARSAYYCISSDANERDIIANNNFENQNYIDISEGQYLDLSRCEAVPFNEKKNVDKSTGFLEEGQYLVGVDIPAGEYKLELIEGKRSAYYGITSDANGKDIIANDNFQGGSYVNVSDGQYLEINRCRLYL